MQHIPPAIRYLSEAPGVAYAAEVGSRVRGTATEESDYDVLVITVMHPLDYLSLSPQRKARGMQIAAAETEIDVMIWDIYKALMLFAASNMGIIDAIMSPVVYADKGMGNALRSLLEKGFYSPTAIIGHCMGMAKKATDERNRSPKRLLLSITSVLRARWAELHETIPPINIHELDASTLYGDAVAQVIDCIVDAVMKGESTVPPDCYHAGIEFINGEYQRLRGYRAGRRAPKVPEETLDEILYSMFATLYPETAPLFSHKDVSIMPLSVSQYTHRH